MLTEKEIELLGEKISLKGRGKGTLRGLFFSKKDSRPRMNVMYTKQKAYAKLGIEELTDKMNRYERDGFDKEVRGKLKAIRDESFEDGTPWCQIDMQIKGKHDVKFFGFSKDPDKLLLFAAEYMAAAEKGAQKARDIEAQKKEQAKRFRILQREASADDKVV